MHSSGLGFDKTGAISEELISEEVHCSKTMGGLRDECTTDDYKRHSGKPFPGYSLIAFVITL